MNHTDVKVGTGIVAKVGCNEVKAVITEIGENGIMARSHKSGKEFRVKTILQVESASEVIRETPKPEKKLSLFSAAIKVMETGQTGQTYSVKELVSPRAFGRPVRARRRIWRFTPRSCATSPQKNIPGSSGPLNGEGSFTPENNLSIFYRMPEAAAAFFVYRKGNKNHFSIVSIIEKMRIFCYFCLINITDDVI